jgi:predicted alpha/beta-hydrolase family hydrolase
MKKLAIYNHGKDSEPWGAKALKLAEVAKQHGFSVVSPDYRAQLDPDERVKQLLAMDISTYDKVLLIGSSMGGYVATVAAETIKPAAMFLMAPAFYLPGYQRTDFNPPADKTLVIHGWQDDIVAPENSWKFCQQQRVRLIMLNDGHRLMKVLPEVMDEFDNFLRNVHGIS